MKNRILLAAVAATALAAALLAGCSSTNTQQISNTTSGDGMLAKIAVPTGQSTSIGASLFVGRFNIATVLQPTSTNKLHTPNLAITVYGAGKQGVTGASGLSGTNGTAGITDGSRDASFLITGDSTASAATGTNSTVSVGGGQ